SKDGSSVWERCGRELSRHTRFIPPRGGLLWATWDDGSSPSPWCSTDFVGACLLHGSSQDGAVVFETGSLEISFAHVGSSPGRAGWMRKHLNTRYGPSAGAD